MKEDYFFNQNLKIGNSNYKILNTGYNSSRVASNIKNRGIILDRRIALYRGWNSKFSKIENNICH